MTLYKIYPTQILNIAFDCGFMYILYIEVAWVVRRVVVINAIKSNVTDVIAVFLRSCTEKFCQFKRDYVRQRG